MLCQFDLHPIEVRLQAHGCEVISMHNQAQLALGVMKTTGARNAGHEAHLLKGSTVRVLPNGAGVPSAIRTADEFADAIRWHSELLRKLHVHRPLRNSIKVGFPNIHEAQLQTLPLAAPLLGKTSKQELLRLERRS